MSESGWHEADPRSPYGGVPGPQTRAARSKSPSRSDRPAAWEGTGWYRDDADPLRSVPMKTGPRRDDEPDWDEPEERSPARRPGHPGRRPDPAPSWRWGEMSGPRGTLIVVAAAVVGSIVTVAIKRDPGPLLGGFVAVGVVIAAFAVRPRAAYLLIPVPALAYLVFGLAAGLILHRADTSTSDLSVSAAQWVANGFVAMAAATGVAIVLGLGRWYLDRRAPGVPAGRRRVEPEERREPGVRREARREPEGRPERARSSFGDQGDRGDRGRQSGLRGSEGRGSQSGRGERARDEAPAPRPKPAFYPNPDPAGPAGDRGRGRDPRDRRPPPGPPSFGASRELGR